MKLIAIITLFSISTTFAMRSNIVSTGFFLQDKNKSFLKIVKKNKDIIIDHVSSLGYEVYGDENLKAWLSINSTVPFYSLETSQKEKNLQSYPSPEQIEEKLQTLALNNSEIFKLESIGMTDEGRELWVMKVSDNVRTDETEPEFKYVANMHGDEIVGRELMVSLLDEIAKKYKANDPEIKNLVDNTEIYIMPSLNPDGAAKRRRGNSNWRDLNRDFPDVENDRRNEAFSFRQRQPETLAMMQFQESRNFSLSANFHGGTEVVNYPWDTKRADFPLLDLILELSTEYASIIPSMRDNNEFENGIVNGYAWYEINGGMQDWSYHWHNDIQVTIELSHSKWPSYNRVSSYYNKNRRSLINYMKRVHQGVGFKNQSLIKGKVTYRKLEGNQYQKIISKNFHDSEFFQVLSPGNYQIEVKTSNNSTIFYKEVKADSIQNNGDYELISL
jgi:hypothetical protein